MLIEQNPIKIKFNKRFYSINAIIAANTKFSDVFSTEVTFAMLNIGEALYHIVRLFPKKEGIAPYSDYVNEVLRYE